MSDFESTKAVLMDLLAEHGDDEAVEALRNLDRLKKVQKHWTRAAECLERGVGDYEGECRFCGGYDHSRDCEGALMLREVLGAAEVYRQEDLAWDAAIGEDRRRARQAELAANPNEVRTTIETLSGLFRELYGNSIADLARTPSRILGLADQLSVSPRTAATMPAIPGVEVHASPFLRDDQAYLLDGRAWLAVDNIATEPLQFTRDPQRPWRTCSCVGSRHRIDCEAA